MPRLTHRRARTCGRTTTSRRTRRAVVALAAGVIGAAIATAVPTPAAGAPALAVGGIAGDPHSTTVIMSATSALAAHDVFSWTSAPGDLMRYVVARDGAADAVAAELGIDRLALRQAWARADLAHQEAVLAALTLIRTAYVSNTADPAVGFDCSGLTAYAWARAGVTITHQSSAQINAAAPRDAATAMAGDLVQYPGHVMMYLGLGEAIVHAANHSTDVAIGFISRGGRWGDPTG